LTTTDIFERLTADKDLLLKAYGLTEGDLIKSSSGQVRTTCPFCRHKDQKFYISKENTTFKCFHCNESGNAISFQHKQGKSKEEAFQFLSDLTGVKLSQKALQNYEQRRRQQSVFQAAQALFVEELKTSEDVLQYLKDHRKYSEEEIKFMKLGAYPEDFKERMKEKGFSEDELNAKGLLYDSCKRMNKLTIPLEDRSGFINSFAFRDILEVLQKTPISSAIRERREKYMYSKSEGDHTKSHTLAGLSATRLARAENAVLVEGVLDALFFNAKIREAAQKAGISEREGFKQFEAAALALGGLSISEEQEKALNSLKLKYITIMLDNDRRGKEETESILLKLIQKGFQVFVRTLTNYKDIDELLRKEGLQGVAENTQLLSWPEYLIKTCKEKSFDAYSERKQLDKLRKYLTLDIKAEDRRDLKKGLVKEFDLREEDIQEEIEDELEALTHRKAEEEAQKIIKDLQGASAKSLERSLEEGLRKIRESRGVELPHVMTFSEFKEALRRKPEGLRTGYKSLDKTISIDSGLLTIIAGRPGHGKTTLMLNLAKNIIEEYSDKTVLFFSYEVSTERIYTQLVMNEAGTIIEPENSSDIRTQYKLYEEYLQKEFSFEYEDVDAAAEKIRQFIDQDRLKVFKEAYNAKDLQAVIRSFSRLHDVVVFVDYIQKIKSSERGKSQRYLEVAEASEALRETAVSLNIPIIAGAQVSRPLKGKMTVAPRLAELREAGDIEQDAALVLGILNRTKAEEEEIEVELSGNVKDKRKEELELLLQGLKESDSHEFKVYILKNRYGATDGTSALDFDGEFSKITDKD